MVLLLILLLTSLGLGQTPTPRPPALDSRAYQFTRVNGNTGASGASGNLSVSGAGKIIAFNLCPTGLVAGRYVYIVGGTGIAEAVPITSTTCTLVGGGIGAITVTTIKVHLLAWRVQSATDGIQEAIYAGGGTGRIVLPCSSILTYAPAMVPDGYSTSIRGCGIRETTILPQFATGDVLVYDFVSVGGNVDVGDFQILDPVNPATSIRGAMLRIRYRSDGVVSNMLVADTYDGISLEGCNRIRVEHVTTYTWHYGLEITCKGVAFPTCVSQGTYADIHVFSMASGVHGIHGQDTTTGLLFDQIFVEGGISPFSNNIAAHFEVTSAGPLNEVVINHSFLDSNTVCLDFQGNGTAYNNNSFQIQNSHLACGNYGVTLGGYVSNVRITGNYIGAGGSGTPANSGGVLIGAHVSKATINDNTINTDGNGCLYTNGGPSEDINFSGNICGNDTSPVYGIYINSALTGLNVVNNTLRGSTGAYIAGVTPANFTIWNNPGIDNVIPTLASAATVTLPINPNVEITGSTTITTMNGGWAGKVVHLTKTDASNVIFTLGGNIATEAFLHPGGTLTCVYPATAWYCESDVYHPSIKGLPAGNGNIVLQPGNVAGNASVVIETTRTDEAALLIKDHSGTNAHDIVEIRDSSNNAYFAILPMSHTIDPGTVITKSIVPLTAGCCEVGTPTRRWGKGSFAAIDAQGGTVGVGNLVVDTDIIVGTGIATVGDVGVGGKLTTGDTVSAPNGYIVGGIPGITRTFTMIKTVNFGASTTTTCTIIVTLGIVTGGTC